MKIKKNDKVKVMAGKDKGQDGLVEKVFSKSNKALVAGVNMYKRHSKGKGDKKKGGIIDITKPLPIASIMLICPKCGKLTRIGYQIDKSGTKMRICKKCKELFN